jgi:hypothetical protein
MLLEMVKQPTLLCCSVTVLCVLRPRSCAAAGGEGHAGCRQPGGQPPQQR